MTGMSRLTVPRYQFAWSTRISLALITLETTATWPEGVCPVRLKTRIEPTAGTWPR